MSTREYEAAAEAVPEAFGIAKSSVSRRCIRASADALRQFHTRRHDDREWLVLLLDGKTFADDQVVIALEVTTDGEKRVLGLVQTAPENRRAYAHGAYADAKRALQRLVAELTPLNEPAARSLEAGLEETLTLNRPGMHEDLRRSLNTTNLIESIMAQIERKTQRVDHWRTSDQTQRWCAATLLQIEHNFRRVRGFKHLPLRQTALTNRLHPTAA